MFDVSLHVFTTVSTFLMLLTWFHVRMKEYEYLEHSLAEKMHLGHARVGIKHMCDRFLKALVTSILLENLFTSCPFELQT